MYALRIHGEDLKHNCTTLTMSFMTEAATPQAPWICLNKFRKSNFGREHLQGRARQGAASFCGAKGYGTTPHRPLRGPGRTPAGPQVDKITAHEKKNFLRKRSSSK